MKKYCEKCGKPIDDRPVNICNDCFMKSFLNGGKSDRRTDNKK
jgi:hypothetical protein